MNGRMGDWVRGRRRNRKPQRLDEEESGRLGEWENRRGGDWVIKN